MYLHAVPYKTIAVLYSAQGQRFGRISAKDSGGTVVAGANLCRSKAWRGRPAGAVLCGELRVGHVHHTAAEAATCVSQNMLDFIVLVTPHNSK